jgi:hypothetical protein
MVSARSLPWYNRPAREFPAKKWLRTKYPFYIPPSLFARYPGGPVVWREREFPARRWLEGKQQQRPNPAGG